MRAVCLATSLALGLIGCERESRRFSDPPSPTPLYENNAWATAEGKRLFQWFNCVGCHGLSGGGMGPPLMDDQWRYGHDPLQIHATIVNGRPNGMPAFGGRIPDPQVWQLVAYVRSLSGQLRIDVAPGRTDHLSGKSPESLKEREQPTPEHAP
jgi:cytochrome c oxidase cbb3-type subunit III